MRLVVSCPICCMPFIDGECIRHDQEEIDAYVLVLIGHVLGLPVGSADWCSAGERLNGYLGKRDSLRVGRFTIHPAGERVVITEEGQPPASPARS